MAKSKVVSAVGVAVGRNEDGSASSRAIEAAMVKAIEVAHAKGVTDPDKLRKLILAARDKAVG